MNEKEWANEIAEKIYKKELEVVKRSFDKIPYSGRNGVFDDMSGFPGINWWTNGFYAALLWQLYNAYGDAIFKDCAEGIEDKLDVTFMNAGAMSHDSGFKWQLTSGANYKITCNPDSKNRLILAADSLAGRLNLKSGLIRAWNDDGSGERSGWAIIDTMMNLSLLYTVSALINDPRYKHIAMCHADNAIKAFIREDGSVRHIVVFDPETGKIIKTLGGQGIDEKSSWTRGQSWAIYGFVISYLHTCKTDYLNAAVKVADHVLSVIPASGLIPVDYDQSNDIDYEDDTAAAITACGLLYLGDVLAKTASKKATKYHETALFLLKTLAELRCNFDLGIDYLLEKCSAAYHDEHHNFSIIYGDYYFAEAILKLSGKELFLW